MQRKQTKYDIMSLKEKLFVSNFIVKNISKSSIDYNKLLKGEKVELRENFEKQEIKKYFGKQTKRSKKDQREAVCCELSPELHEKMQHMQIYDTLSIIKNIEIDNETQKELEFELFDMCVNMDYLDYMCVLRDIYDACIHTENIFNYFLVRLFSRTTFIRNLNQKLQHMGRSNEFFQFLDVVIETKPVITVYTEDITFYKDLFRTPDGISLGVFLLLNNPHFAKIFDKILCDGDNLAQNSDQLDNLKKLVSRFNRK
ncbi:hypothetical protein ECANGB1_1228 [Enterospora canceri]|uniref:Uncharacterized protein n=1 Tax=Enterospora canceri TaxID=1081671 RepID=A0A1Y1S6J3_9MICR|nr:hypothetical protein ECANGB1_1228 [Enterospora canceri]